MNKKKSKLKKRKVPKKSPVPKIRTPSVQPTAEKVEGIDLTEIVLYVFLKEDAELPPWFRFGSETLPESLDSKVPTKFIIPFSWHISNSKTEYAFKVPDDAGEKGRYIGCDSNYLFYLRHILVTRKPASQGAGDTDEDFLILFDIEPHLRPELKKEVDELIAKGEKIEYHTVLQPSYNIYCPIYQRMK